MEILTIAETKSTPRVHFDLIKGTIDIKGVSIPEYPKEFYSPLMEAIDRYAERSHWGIVLNLSLIYFNSSSARYLLHIFETIKHLGEIAPNVVVNWYYDSSDEDQLETAKDLESLAQIKFNYIPV